MLRTRTGSIVRKTPLEVGQAPHGCHWFAQWTARVADAERRGQRAVIVYNKARAGVRLGGGLGGLGYSQLKELEYLNVAVNNIQKVRASPALAAPRTRWLDFLPGGAAGRVDTPAYS